MSLQVTQINTPDITAYQISMASPADTMEALAALARLHWRTNAIPSPGSGVWVVSLTPPEGGKTTTLNEGDWITIDSTGSVATFNPPEFVRTHTADMPLVWQGTASPPSASSTSATAATILFPLPTSANSPWTYSATQSTDGKTYTEAATLEPNIQDSWVHLGVTGLDFTKNTYTFKAKVSTQYQGVHAESLPTNEVSFQG